MRHRPHLFVPFIFALLSCLPAPAAILWHDDGARLVHKTGIGADILAGR
jgi:hypothetical protein